MKKNNVLLIIMVIITINIWAQEFPDRMSELVKVFPVGTGDGELGFYKEMSADGTWIGSGPSRPAAFCFNYEGLLYIVDTINERICIYDQDYQFIRSIDPSPIMEPFNLEVDNEGNIIGHIYGGIQEMDTTGKELITVYIENNDIRDSIRSDGFYIVDNMVLAYRRTPEGGIIGFNNPGTDYKENNKHILDTHEVIREIERNHPTLRVETRIEPTVQQRSSTRGPIVPGRQNEEYIIYENGVEQSRNFDSFMESEILDATLHSKTMVNNNLNALVEKYEKKRLKSLLGIDNDNNTYWLFHIGIFVFNPSIVPIAAFEMNYKRNTAGPVVSPSGDVYYMFSDETGHYLYKYERDW